MKNNRWCFRNLHNPSSTIIVEGEDSAAALRAALGEKISEWNAEEIPGKPPQSLLSAQLMASPATPNGSSCQIPPPLYVTERRNNRGRFSRYNVEFRVVLVAAGRAFRTISSDVSVGGMQLKGKIPDAMLDKECRIIITCDETDENIELACRTVGDPSNPCRLKFTESDTIALKKLEQWILSASTRQLRLVS